MQKAAAMPQSAMPQSAMPKDAEVPATEIAGNLSPEQSRRRRARSVALALVLAGLVVMLWLVTVLKLGPGAAIEPF